MYQLQSHLTYWKLMNEGHQLESNSSSIWPRPVSRGLCTMEAVKNGQTHTNTSDRGMHKGNAHYLATPQCMYLWKTGCTPFLHFSSFSLSHPLPQHCTYAFIGKALFFIENMWIRRCVWPWVTERLVMGVVSGTGFLSRWHLQDWQDAILCWNSVSQPASLSARQPLTPLNLAFCWAVTGLQATLHVAILINCTINPNAVGTYVDGFSSLWCRYKRPLSSLSFVPLSFSHHTASYLPL